MAYRGTTVDYVTLVAIVVSVVWTISFLVTFILACGAHISAYWGSEEGLAKYCGNGGFAVEDAFYISDFVTDVLILLIPIPMVCLIQNKEVSYSYI